MSTDLHTHSTYSDGVLTPADLVRRAAARGVTVLALTDHDDTGGIEEALQAAAETSITLVPGVEISTTWDERTVHILGLGIDVRAPRLAEALASIRRSRVARAVRIAAQLDAAGIPGSLAGATRQAGASSVVGRSHFARFLVAQKHVRNANDAFRLYLANGRPGYVAPQWPQIASVVEWIHDAGGHAVLAHPDRYRLTQQMLRSLFGAFALAGGDAVEVNGEGRFGSSLQVRMARDHGFALSSGSDFHAPGKGVPDLGDATAIPPNEPAILRRLLIAA